MNVIQVLFSFIKQKYLRRFYDLPAALQGKSSGTFETKIKAMQRFFNLKVTQSGKLLILLLLQMSCFVKTELNLIS